MQWASGTFAGDPPTTLKTTGHKNYALIGGVSFWITCQRQLGAVRAKYPASSGVSALAQETVMTLRREDDEMPM